MALGLGPFEAWLLPLLYKTENITSDSYSTPLTPFPLTLKPLQENGLLLSRENNVVIMYDAGLQKDRLCGLQ